MPASSRSRWLAAVLSACLSGCATASNADTNSALDTFNEETGGLAGVVTSESLEPLANADVKLVGTNHSAVTGIDGGFLFRQLPPGPYRLRAEIDAYEAVERDVEVTVAEVTRVSIGLTLLPVEGAYFEMFPYVGFQPCQWWSPGGYAHCTYPYTNAYGTAKGAGFNLSQSGLPKDLQDNREKYNFTVFEGHTRIVSELFWRATSAAATQQLFVVSCAWYDPVQDLCVPPGNATWYAGYARDIGRSPLRLEWVHPKPEWLPWVESRANVFGNTTDGDAVGLAFEQKIEMYNTVFYGMEPAEGFSVRPEGLD